jgi:hypothetical protein
LIVIPTINNMQINYIYSIVALALAALATSALPRPKRSESFEMNKRPNRQGKSVFKQGTR